MDKALRKGLFNSFAPRNPLPPGDPRYVECSVERGSVGLLDILADAIRLSENPTCQLLSGNSGCGKTTELWRLQRELRSKGSNYFVVYCESDDYLELNDVEYSDILFAIVQGLSKATEAAGIQLLPGKFQNYVTNLLDILGHPAAITFQAGLANIGFEIKNSPSKRQQVREQLHPQGANFVQAVNDVIENAQNTILGMEAAYDGLVVIVDNLDRIIREPVQGTQLSNYDQLFVKHATQLRDLACHIIYTIPLTLLNSPSGAQLHHLFTTEPIRLPMIPVEKRDGSEDNKGLLKLFEAIERRCVYAGTTSKEVFCDEESVRQLCFASGGYIRTLMTLAQSSLQSSQAACISKDDVEQAIRRRRINLAAGITPSQWPLLREVAEKKEINTTDDNYLQLLDNFSILEYCDESGMWYDVSPILRDTAQMKS